jgi:hypothetical protein
MSTIVAHRIVHVAGLLINVYTNGDLSAIKGKVAVLFVLHGRGGDAAALQSRAERTLDRVAEKGAQERELVVVTFVSVWSHQNP